MGWGSSIQSSTNAETAACKPLQCPSFRLGAQDDHAAVLSNPNPGLTKIYLTLVSPGSWYRTWWCARCRPSYFFMCFQAPEERTQAGGYNRESALIATMQTPWLCYYASSGQFTTVTYFSYNGASGWIEMYYLYTYVDVVPSTRVLTKLRITITSCWHYQFPYKHGYAWLSETWNLGLKKSICIGVHEQKTSSPMVHFQFNLSKFSTNTDSAPRLFKSANPHCFDHPQVW